MLWLIERVYCTVIYAPIRTRPYTLHTHSDMLFACSALHAHENRCTPATRRPLWSQSTSFGGIQRECSLWERLSGPRCCRLKTCGPSMHGPQCRHLHQLQRANAAALLSAEDDSAEDYPTTGLTLEKLLLKTVLSSNREFTHSLTCGAAGPTPREESFTNSQQIVRKESISKDRFRNRFVD